MNKCEQYCRTIKRMSITGGGGLPAEYSAVEYLQSSGTQYIDTGISTHDQNDIHITVDCTMPYYSGSEWGYVVFGGFNNNISSGANSGTYAIYKNTNNIGFFYRNGNPVFQKTISVDGTRYVTDIDIDNNNVTYSAVRQSDQQTYTATGTASGSNTPAGSILLYAQRGYAQNTVNAYASIKVYRFTISFNNSEVLDFIPCYRKSDNVAGMYDLARKTFFTNSGSGSFTV